MNETIYNELMKLPRDMLHAMCREANVTPPRGYNWGNAGYEYGRASKDDAARALAPWLAKRDFMRDYCLS